MSRSLSSIISLIILFTFTVSTHAADVTVRKVDFLQKAGLDVNGAGPVLVRSDKARGRMIAVNTLSPSVSLIDCATGGVRNIPIGGRAFQHLKAEAMTVSASTGDIYLIGRNCFHIVSVSDEKSVTVETGVQFESIAVHEKTGNVFLAGRESRKLGFYKASSKKLKMLDWLGSEEELINLNATPPPPIRKVVVDNALSSVVAVDGKEPAIYIFSAGSGKKTGERTLDLSPGGRWHLAGYDERTHRLYIVTETDERKVVQAARIDIAGGEDAVAALPGYTEGVGIIYNPSREEVYIPYDNHPSVHVVDFGDGASLSEIMIPAYGNDGSAVDEENGLLYIASWAFGEIDVIDLHAGKMLERFTGLGIIPHMFTLAFDPGTGRLYFPKGASAVNGTFGAAVSWFDPGSGESGKVRTGWAPVDLIELECRGSVLVFGSEDRFAEVKPDGSFEEHSLPFDYPVRACRSPEGDVYLSYGPHQSYWPTVYIWDAKNGILTIDKGDLSFYDRRIPRQAHELVLDRGGVLYFTQNNWGKEEQFIGRMRDQVRVFEVGDRIRMGEDVEREITQRILRYDGAADLLYLVKTGEKDDQPSVLQVVDPDSSKVVHRFEAGITATDLSFDGEKIYVTGFDSDDITIIDRNDWSRSVVSSGRQPLRLQSGPGGPFVLCHGDNSVRDLRGQTWKIPWKGKPDNIFPFRGGYVITSIDGAALRLIYFRPEEGEFSLVHLEPGPYGDTSMDSRNVSFYMRGQYGDAIFSLTRAVTDSKGRLWISDFLAGAVYILE